MWVTLCPIILPANVLQNRNLRHFFLSKYVRKCWLQKHKINFFFYHKIIKGYLFVDNWFKRSQAIRKLNKSILKLYKQTIVNQKWQNDNVLRMPIDTSDAFSYQQPMKEMPLILPVYKYGRWIWITCQRSCN